MKLIVTTVESVEPWGEKLSLVKVAGVEHTVVANRKDDGSFRWEVGQPVVYVPENAILPQDVLLLRGYWEAGAKKGMLASGKGNRVKGRTFGKVTAEDGTVTDPGVESKGLLFKVDPKFTDTGRKMNVSRVRVDNDLTVVGDPTEEYTIDFDTKTIGGDYHSEGFSGKQVVVFKNVQIGDDVTEFFGATEFTG
jgi:hypothetical protein